MSHDDLGDRMKIYEMAEAGRTLMPFLPAMLRLDGKAFHTFTSGFERPYDVRFSDSMVDLTIELVKFTGAKMGYTQSDEITLLLWQSDIRQELFFGGRIQKLTSIVASFAGAKFNQIIHTHGLPVPASALPIFDCRAWNVPNKTEAVNVFVWRENDAVKNSIQMAARSVFSHKDCDHKNGAELQDMLHAKGINWNDYPTFFKRGTYVRSETLNRKLTTQELEELPPKHNARLNPDMIVARSEVQRIDMPILTKVFNREEVFFRGDAPTTDEDYRSKNVILMDVLGA